MFDNIMQSLSSNILESLVYIAIAIITLIGVVKCIYPLFRNAALLNRAVTKLEKSTAAGERPLWREARFLGRSLRGRWQEFLLNAGQLDMRGMPCDLKDYINEESIIDQPGHSQLAELIPGLLTSLGILGTFMGLMQGLTNVNFQNAQGTIESIPHLLDGMSYAFATSVAGITCSLSFNILNRVAVGRAFHALDTFDDSFYELAMPRPLQPEVQMICQKQDDEKRALQLAESVSGHVSASLEAAVANAMAPLSQSLDAFIHGATQEQVEGIRSIVAQFTQQMNLSLNGQLHALADTMGMINQGQAQMQQTLQGTLMAMRAMTEDARAIHQAGSGIAAAMHSLNNEMQSIKNEQLDSMAAAEQGALKLAQQLEDLSESLSGMQQAIDMLTAELNGQPQPVQSSPTLSAGA